MKYDTYLDYIPMQRSAEDVIDEVRSAIKSSKNEEHMQGFLDRFTVHTVAFGDLSDKKRNKAELKLVTKFLKENGYNYQVCTKYFDDLKWGTKAFQKRIFITWDRNPLSLVFWHIIIFLVCSTSLFNG